MDIVNELNNLLSDNKDLVVEVISSKTPTGISFLKFLNMLMPDNKKISAEVIKDSKGLILDIIKFEYKEKE